MRLIGPVGRASIQSGPSKSSFSYAPLPAEMACPRAPGGSLLGQMGHSTTGWGNGKSPLSVNPPTNLGRLADEPESGRPQGQRASSQGIKDDPKGSRQRLMGPTTQFFSLPPQQ